MLLAALWISFLFSSLLSTSTLRRDELRLTNNNEASSWRSESTLAIRDIFSGGVIQVVTIFSNQGLSCTFLIISCLTCTERSQSLINADFYSQWLLINVKHLTSVETALMNSYSDNLIYSSLLWCSILISTGLTVPEQRSWAHHLSWQQQTDLWPSPELLQECCWELLLLCQSLCSTSAHEASKDKKIHKCLWFMSLFSFIFSVTAQWFSATINPAPLSNLKSAEDICIISAVVWWKEVCSKRWSQQVFVPKWAELTLCHLISINTALIVPLLPDLHKDVHLVPLNYQTQAGSHSRGKLHKNCISTNTGIIPMWKLF